MALPIFQSDNATLTLLQTKWASEINPLLAKPQNQGLIIPGVVLAIGSNLINHRLGRKLQGWSIVRKRAAAEIYDTQDTNVTPDLTLRLVSDAVVTVDILCY